MSLVMPPSKLPAVGTTIFTVMSRLAADHGAINLSQGFPDFASPPRLLERVAHHMAAGANQYAPLAGVLPLREAIATKAEALYGATYDVEHEITVTAGATQAIFTAVAAFVRPGDEVIVFAPAYDSYVPAIDLNGGRAVFATLRFPAYRPDWDEVARLITPKTRMIIINTPHNPTATIFSDADIERLRALTRNTDIVILADEVYEHVVFDGAKHQSMACYQDLAERSVIVSSFGKSYHVTGWRVGYCLAPAALMDEIRKVHQFMVFSADTPMQYAFAEALQNRESYLGLSAFYQHKRDLLKKALSESRFELLPSEGSFFMLARFHHFSDESDSDFVLRLIRDAQVATIPLSAFYTDGTDSGLIRLSFSKDDATLLEGARRLCSI
jgi:methionine transaminase